MPVEEHKELHDLVNQTLQAKGVLQKVQAEIRASVFLALEEQDVFKDKNLFINQPLKDYVSTSEGVLVISLVREFMEFFNLEFATMVFDPETHAGIDYSYDGRTKLCTDLMLDSNVENKTPLLGMVVKLLTSAIKKNVDTNSSKSTIKSEMLKEPENVSDNTLIKHLSNGEPISVIVDVNQVRSSIAEIEKSGFVSDRLSTPKERAGTSSLSSLGNLPPLTMSSSHNTIDKQQPEKEEISALNLETGFEEDLSSQKSDKTKKDNKTETTVSEESEIEEEISDVHSAPTDDNTAEFTISNESGKGDYFEEL